MSFPQYPEYKDSGVEWLGEVPAHWSLCRFKQVFKERVGRSQDGIGELLSVSAYWGVRPRSESREEGEHLSRADSLEGYKLCETGDLVMNIMLAWNRGLGFARQSGIVSPAYSVFSVADGSEPRFLDYLVRSDEYIRYYKAFSAGVIDSRLRLYPEVFGRLTSALPTYDEQGHIAAFLDHETARIDELIDEQKRLIELLKEKRQAVISHAVTKGLNPDVPMKDSEVEWLGEVPKHWKVKRVKHVVRLLEQGWSPQCENIAVKDESEWGVLKVGCVNHGRFNYLENKKLPNDFSPRVDLAIKANDVLISRANTRELVGSCAVPTIDYPNLMLSDKLFRLRLHSLVADPLFLSFYMGASQTKKQIELEATGASSSMLNIGQSTVLEMPFPCPPLEEQVKIRDKIIKQNYSLLNLAGEALALKERLEERRSALISATVTGKIDVRNWQPGQATEQPELPMVAEAHATYS
ncbi:hypothetical protein [Vreelandella sp. GE22]